MRSVALALAMLCLEACSSSTPPNDTAGDAGPASTCPSDLPGTCPMPTPSYKDQAQGVIESRCWQCHADGGVAQQGNDFSTYDQIFRQRSGILNQVYSCQMPPSDAGPLTAEERAILLGWLVCRAPDN